jgi:hypothetical protein
MNSPKRMASDSKRRRPTRHDISSANSLLPPISENLGDPIR